VYGSEKEIGVMIPEKNVYKYEGNREINQETEVALRSTLKDDLYVILANFDSSGTANFRAMVNPMVSWIWAGGVVLILGAIVTMWPSAREIREESAVRYNVEVTKESTVLS
jgi:cytochrome c-type biogenesis protein CcmF